MSLNGNLEVFPLEEVLRLLARSRKSGCLRVETGGVQGRIFLNGGAMSLATVAGDEELRRRLIGSGLVSEADVRKIELSGAPITESLAEGATPAALTDFVREESVEGLYRIRRTGRGSFDFLMELSPRYPTGQSFDAEVIVSEADRRALEWEDIESVLPGMDTVLRMVPELSDEETVTINPATWRILASLGGGASIGQVARQLGLSDFRAAREMASLFRNGLVTTDGAVVSSVQEVATEAPVAMPVESDDPQPAADEPLVAEEPAAADVPVEDAAPVFVEAPVEEAPVEEAPVEEAQIEVAAVEVATDEPVIDTVAEAEPWSIEQDNEPVEAAEAEVAVEEAVEVTADEPSEPEVSAWGGATGGEEAASWWTDTAEPVDVAVEDDFAAQDDAPGADPVETAAAEPSAPWSDSPWKAEIPTAEPEVQASPWGGWVTSDHSDPVADPEPESVAPSAEAPVESEPQAEAETVDRTGGWWAETMGAAESTSGPAADSDADRFLESVFSSLSEENEESQKATEEEDETGFGMGLLRRRRMGAAARDISDNNR